MYTQLSNDVLIGKILEGENQLFEELWNRYRKFVFVKALKYVSVRQDAEDISQEVFIKVYLNLPYFRRDANFNAWISAIVDSTSIDWLRKLDPNIQSIEDDKISIFCNNLYSDSDCDSVGQARKLQMIIGGINSLDNDVDKKILSMFYLKGLKVKTIALRLGMKSRTVRNRLCCSRSRLKEKLVKKYGKEVC